MIAIFRGSLVTIKDSALYSDLKTENGYIKRAKKFIGFKVNNIELYKDSELYKEPYKIIKM